MIVAKKVKKREDSYAMKNLYVIDNQ